MITLAGIDYKSPNIPSYDVLLQNCLCAPKKKPLFYIQHSENAQARLSSKCIEGCACTAIRTVLGRQAGARVSPDPTLLKEFAVFSEKFIDMIVDDFVQDGVTIDFNG